MGAFTDLEMKRERSKRNKREREREDIECDHVASITRRYTTQQTISIDHRERAGNRRRRFCRKVFCVIVLPLACCETRLHFIPNTNPVFISPSRYSLYSNNAAESKSRAPPAAAGWLLAPCDVAPDSCQFIGRAT